MFLCPPCNKKGISIMAVRARINADSILREISPKSKNSIDKKLEKRLVDSINNAAFKAREATPKYINKKIDRPTAFTLRLPYVHKAKKGKLQATVSSLTLQDKYLSVLELGMTEKNIQTPLKGSEDRYGNLRKKFTRQHIQKTLEETFQVSRIPKGMKFGAKHGTETRKAAQKRLGTRETKRYFIGRPDGKGTTYGLWRRMTNNKKLKLVFEFDRARKYKKSLNLRTFWTREATKHIMIDLAKRWFKGGSR